MQGLPLLSTFMVNEWLMMFRDIKISIIYIFTILYSRRAQPVKQRKDVKMSPFSLNRPALSMMVQDEDMSFDESLEEQFAMAGPS